MSYRGAIDFSHLRNAINSGFKPEVRVFLQEIGLDGRAGSRVREVKGFSGVTINRQMGARGTAVISFQNVYDRYFQGRGDGPNGRMFSSANREATRAALTKLLKKSLPYVKEINPLRRLLGQDGAFQGPTAFNEERIASYLDHVYNFTLDKGVRLDRSALKNTGVDFVDLITLGLMQRVFIDIQGQDGLWYAGFTGLVSSVNDGYTPGDVPTVNLRCVDLWRLFDLTEIVVKQGPGVDNPADPTANVRDTIFFEVQEKLGLTADDYRASVFDTTPGQLIVYQILKLTQNALSYIPNLLNLNSQLVQFQTSSGELNVTDELQLGPELKEVQISQNEEAIQARSQFFFDDGFWTLSKQTELKADYEGHNCLRRVRPGLNFTRAIEADGTDRRDQNGYKTDKLVYVTPRSPDGRSTRRDGEGIQDGDFVGTLLGSYYLDKFIEAGTQGIVYQELIKQIIGPWQVQQASGASVLKKVADASFYDMFVTGNGDFVYQVPRHNNHPGEFRATISDPRSTAVSVPVTTPAQLETQKNNEQLQAPVIEIGVDYGNLTEDGLYDYSPGPVRYPSKYHGYNYSITDMGLIRWDFQRSEEPLVTVMRVPGGSHLLNPNGVLQNTQLTGRTDLELTRTLQQRFGVRARTSQQIFIPNLYGGIGNARALLDKFAFGLLQQVNGLSDGGTVTLHSRPDLELGRNIAAVERQKLYYIVGVNYDIKVGQSCTSTLSVAYGHDWGEEIPNPWTLVNLADLLPPADLSKTPNVPGDTRTAASPQSGLPVKITSGTSDTWRTWVWPVPTLTARGNAAIPEISDSFYTPEMRPDKRGGRGHYGVDIFYRRLAGEPGVPHNGTGKGQGDEPEAGKAEGTRVKGYFNPDGVPILAAGPGDVYQTGYTSKFGNFVIIDHHNVKGFGKLATFYQHLSSVAVTKGQRVVPGQRLGVIGRPPSEPRGLVHLHFEMWHMRFKDFLRERDAIDPQPIMKLWGRAIDPTAYTGFTIAPGFTVS